MGKSGYIPEAGFRVIDKDGKVTMAVGDISGAHFKGELLPKGSFGVYVAGAKI